MATKRKNEKKFFAESMKKQAKIIWINEHGDLVADDTQNAMQVLVFPSISIEKMSDFVKECIDIIFDSIGTYRPERMAMAIEYAIAKYFTDLKMDFSLDDIRQLYYNTNLFVSIRSALEYCGQQQLVDLSNAVRSTIDWKLRYENSFTKYQIDAAVSKLEETVEQMAMFFGDVSVPDAMQAMKHVGDVMGRVDDKDLVHAIIQNIKTQDGV